MITSIEPRGLNELIDRHSTPVAALASFLRKTEDETFSLLEKSFEEAKAVGELSHEGKTISFSTDYADITLVPNNDSESQYSFYLKFRFKREQYYDRCIRNLANCAEGVFPDNIDNLIAPEKILRLINGFITGINTMPDMEIVEVIKTSYKKALALGKIREYEGCYNFDTDLVTYKSSIIIVGIKPTLGFDGNIAWLLNYAAYTAETKSDGFSTALSDFCGSEDSKWLPELAALAMKEEWYFKNEGTNPVILRNYINYLFYRMLREDKIQYNDSNTLAAFNTGLYNFAYEDIYMIFDKKKSEDKWNYAGVCTAGNGHLGKRLVGSLAVLPEREKFLFRFEDIYYNTSLTLYPDFNHILSERIHRIPLGFVEKSCYGHTEALGIIESLKKAESEDEIEILWARLRDLIRADNDLFNELMNDFDYVIEKTIKKVSRNYHLAIPAYYAKNNAMCFLLPLYFGNSQVPEAAIVAELNESGSCYKGHTILSRRQAYCDARLVCRQDNSWLTI